jgi:hypothetical protein
MLKKVVLFWIIFCFSGSFAQEKQSTYTTKKISFTNDTISIEKISINPSFFRLLDKDKTEIDSSFYHIDFQKAKLVFKPNYISKDSITINYLKFPDFLTKEYSIYDDSRVVPNQDGNLYSLQKDVKTVFKPFDGLTTSGSITRGVTIGNNQNAVVNSNLDLQITGKISDKVSIRASIEDSNLPLQNSGYSQRINEFDQIFIELFSNKWNLRAGDIFLENRKSRFLNFNKKVQGLSTNFNFGNETKKTNVYASAALVRGQYAKSNFIGQEGNQGPYKLKGQNGELYIIVISGSERVFINGILLKRGEENDYTIDYNAGEIKFTSLYPITSEMRITIEYQFTDQNYTRFVTYFGGNHEQEKWSIGANVYSENDSKNQPLQQNISPEQAQILSAAGDDQQLMNSVSAYEDTFSENKILYKKTIFNGVEIFEFSNLANDVLFNVKFSLVGTNQGNYILKNGNAIGKIFEYIAPIAGIKQGNYEPIVRLIAPTKIEIASITGKFFPTEKTNLDFELGVSNNDLNLFSSQNDTDNKGLAGKINAKQRLFSRKWTVDGLANFQFVQKEFRTIERLYTIEFNRDWNITTVAGNQNYLNSGLVFSLPEKGTINYQFENLSFSDNFSGNRQQINSNFKLKNWTFNSQNSYLQSNGNVSKSKFLRSQTQSKYHFKKNWVGASIRGENNQEKLKITNEFSALSQKFFETGAFVGRGDSTKVYTEIGFLHRVNDSLQNNRLKRVNTSQSYYLKSKLIQTEKNNLSVFINYRNLKFEDKSKKNEPSLNSKIAYNDRFFDQLLVTSTGFETNSGTIAQQEFTYLQVEPGRGVYTWNDYNNNGIQEIQEFEIAVFQDQAKFVRLFLPNQIFIKTNQNKFSQTATFNFIKFQNQEGFLKILSYFYNQTSFLIDRKIKRDGNKFDLNPFKNSETNLLGLNSSFQNSLYYNRGKQNHSVTYLFVTNNLKNQLSVGSQQNKSYTHQLRYEHLMQVNWLFSFESKTIKTTSESENFATRNFAINGFEVAPKISYLFSKTASWDLFYDYKKKENTIGELENLKQSKFGTSFSFANDKKFSMNGEFSFYDNNFVGNEQTAAGFQILEGLQAGKNTTWRLMVQKNLTQFLELNLNYQGRKSEKSQAIHTGNVQLRAYF